MTGQVKEEVLTRWGELGLRVIDGRLSLAPGLLAPTEIVPPAGEGGPGRARFTYCGLPMVVAADESDSVVVERVDGTREVVDGLTMSTEQSHRVFARSPSIHAVEWRIGPDTMRRWAGLHEGPAV